MCIVSVFRVETSTARSLCRWITEQARALYGHVHLPRRFRAWSGGASVSSVDSVEKRLRQLRWLGQEEAPSVSSAWSGGGSVSFVGLIGRRLRQLHWLGWREALSALFCLVGKRLHQLRRLGREEAPSAPLAWLEGGSVSSVAMVGRRLHQLHPLGREAAPLAPSAQPGGGSVDLLGRRLPWLG